MKRLAMNRQRGLTIPMLALFIMVFFALAALAIDLGVLYTARTSSQHAADAAALAGAFTFLNPFNPQPESAQNAAVAVAADNQILGQSVEITAANVIVDIPQRMVTVTVPRTGDDGITTYFARAMGTYEADVVTRATAQASQWGTGSRCIKPLFIPNTALSDLPTAQEACDAGEIIFENGQITEWAMNLMGSGAQHRIKPGNPANALNPGQFYALDFGAGADTYRCTLGMCANDCGVDSSIIRCGQGYPIKTGNMVGPTKQGVLDLIGDSPDVWIGLGQYQRADGNIYDTSRSLATAPVWDDCVQGIDPGTHGQVIEVDGFVMIFFDGMQGNDVLAHVERGIECPADGGEGAAEPSPTGDNTGPYSVPVRLVQTPENQ